LKKIVQKVGVFLATTEQSVNPPRFTTNPPQLHHKKPPRKHAFSQNHPQKLPIKRKKAPATAGAFYCKSKN
jgi:hypothetical protein